MSVKHFYVAAAAAVFACAGSGAQGRTTVPQRGNILTAQEIASTHADVNSAYEAVTRLRPNWLGRGPATVFVDGELMGGPEALRTMGAQLVGSMRYYDVTQATAKFGLRAGTTGAIEIILKNR